MLPIGEIIRAPEGAYWVLMLILTVGTFVGAVFGIAALMPDGFPDGGIAFLAVVATFFALAGVAYVFNFNPSPDQVYDELLEKCREQILNVRLEGGEVDAPCRDTSFFRETLGNP